MIFVLVSMNRTFLFFGHISSLVFVCFCRNLADLDVLSKSDPMCVMFMKDIKTGTYYEVWKKYEIQTNDIIDINLEKRSNYQVHAYTVFASDAI